MIDELDDVTPEELREALLRAMRGRSRATLERLAAGFEAINRADLARQCLAIAATKPQLH